MGIVGASLHLTIETCLEAVLEEVVRSKASVVVIDSIQTVLHSITVFGPGLHRADS